MSRHLEDGTPLRPGVWVADTSAPMLLAYGVALALFERERTGRGQEVDISLLAAAVALQVVDLVQLEADPSIPEASLWRSHSERLNADVWRLPARLFCDRLAQELSEQRRPPAEFQNAFEYFVFAANTESGELPIFSAMSDATASTPIASTMSGTWRWGSLAQLMAQVPARTKPAARLIADERVTRVRRTGEGLCGLIRSSSWFS